MSFLRNFLPGDLLTTLSIREAHTNVGDSEHPGGMMSYCSEAAKYSDEQGTLLSNFWRDVDYTEGQGVNGQRYAQRMFSRSALLP